jgi:hypothetical protein
MPSAPTLHTDCSARDAKHLTPLSGQNRHGAGGPNVSAGGGPLPELVQYALTQTP